jgi:hypothetical protein
MTFKSPSAVNAGLAPQGAGPQPASPSFTPGVNPGPVSAGDPPAVSTSVNGILLTPSTVQSQADIQALQK